jgi:hypothetical protein
MDGLAVSAESIALCPTRRRLTAGLPRLSSDLSAGLAAAARHLGLFEIQIGEQPLLVLGQTVVDTKWIFFAQRSHAGDGKAGDLLAPRVRVGAGIVAQERTKLLLLAWLTLLPELGAGLVGAATR